MRQGSRGEFYKNLGVNSWRGEGKSLQNLGNKRRGQEVIKKEEGKLQSLESCAEKGVIRGGRREGGRLSQKRKIRKKTGKKSNRRKEIARVLE